MKRLFFICLLCSSVFQLKANDSIITPANLKALESSEHYIRDIAYKIVNDSLEDDRFKACRDFIPAFVNSLKTENSFYYPYDSLETISTIYAPDSSFRIFTWQLYVNPADYRYYGAIQMNTKELSIFPLIDRSFEIEDVQYKELQADEWYGALYYNMVRSNYKGEPCYLLFGYDAYTFFSKRKLIDVIRFEEGKPVFGAPIFIDRPNGHPATMPKRYFVDYSSEASITLNFVEEENKIIFDHLIEVAVNSNGRGVIQVPDGSYEGFVYQEDGWYHVEKVYDQISDEPPMPSPVLEARKDGVFGPNERRMNLDEFEKASIKKEKEARKKRKKAARAQKKAN